MLFRCSVFLDRLSVLQWRAELLSRNFPLTIRRWKPARSCTVSPRVLELCFLFYVSCRYLTKFGWKLMAKRKDLWVVDTAALQNSVCVYTFSSRTIIMCLIGDRGPLRRLCPHSPQALLTVIPSSPAIPINSQSPREILDLISWLCHPRAHSYTSEDHRSSAPFPLRKSYPFPFMNLSSPHPTLMLFDSSSPSFFIFCPRISQICGTSHSCCSAPPLGRRHCCWLLLLHIPPHSKHRHPYYALGSDYPSARSLPFYYLSP